MAKGDIGADTIITIGLLAGGAYLLATGQIKTVIERLKEGLDSIGGTVSERLPPIPTPSAPGVPSGPAGPISSTGTCVGTALQPDHQGSSKRWESGNIPGNPSSYEVTWCGTFSGDDLTFKMYGPSHHSSGDCCWCVMHVKPNGQMVPGGEGPHPSSNCEHGGGGSAGKATCYKAVMRPGPVQEGYALIGGQWKLLATYKGPCGCSKKSSSKTGNTLMVRNDGNITTKCASVRPLGAAAASASYARAYRTYNTPHITNDVNTGRSCTDLGQGNVTEPKITIA